MNDDIATLKQIRSQLLELMKQITANPKPSYTIEGQRVDWSNYLQQLQAAISWCEERLRALEPQELHTQGETS